MTLKGFTLIELLVVVAIVSILAAVLFPVFAQAKDAAKDIAVLSNMRQLGQGTLMYCNDADDSLPLAWQDGDGSANTWTWQGGTQPYTRSWGLFEHPKLPAPSGEHSSWERLQYFGVLPRIEALRTTSSSYQTNLGALTGRNWVASMGMFGAGTRGMFSYQPGSTPSWAVGQVADPAETMLLCEAGNWDMLIGVYGASQPFSFCAQNGTWGPGWSPHAGQMVYAGPHAHKRTKNGRSGIGSECNFPDGLTTLVAADGSAKALDFRTRVLERVQLADGTYVFRHFWPAGI